LAISSRQGLLIGRFLSRNATTARHLASVPSASFNGTNGSSQSRGPQWASKVALVSGGFLAGCCLTVWQLRRQRSFSEAAGSGVALAASANRPTPPTSVNHIADLVELVSPTAVNIRVEGSTALHSMLGMPSSQGSGFIIREDGLILTNAHVAGRFKGSLVVTLTDGRELPAELIAIDAESDMALVKVSARDLPVLPLGQSKRCRAGEWVIAIGSPLTLSNTVTVGILSNTARNLGTGSNIEYLQTDAAITFGNSGGPLVDMHGQAIGINTLKADAGISFAIPIDEAKNFVDQALSTSRQVISRPKAYLGLTLLSLNPTIARRVFGRDGIDKGVLVHSVHPDSPAQRAGLASYDVILTADGEPVRRVSDLHRAVAKATQRGGGKSVTVRLLVLRSGRELQLDVQPELQGG
ncbi:hypothetical protein BOX15_Mlig032997g1, partial [Macrostomum lignano]